MKSFFIFLTALTVLLSTTYAEENRVEPGCRGLTTQEQKELNDIESKENPTTKEKKEIPVFSDNQLPPVIFENDNHNIIGISPLANYVIIEDESRWEVKYGYEKEVSTWGDRDAILILMNDSFYSSFFQGYYYKMVNTRTNTAIEVKIDLNPMLDNPYTLSIVGFNSFTYEIFLSDNSIWKCKPNQSYIFNKLLLGDVIIVGSNLNGLDRNKYNNILINVNIQRQLKAYRVQ